MLDDEVGLLLDGTIERLPDRRLIVRVQALAPHFHRDASVRGGLVAEQLERAAVPVGVAGAQVAVPDGNARTVHNELEAQLTLAQRLLGLTLSTAKSEVGIDTQQEHERRRAHRSRDRVHADRQCIAGSGGDDGQTHAGQLPSPPPF